MGSIAWESAKEVLLNPWVTSYLMPAVMGTWLAIITANIIYIRDMKARVLMELVNLHLRLGALDFKTHHELDVRTTLLYQPLLLIGEDLTRRSFFTYEAFLQKTYADHTAVVLDAIKKVIEERLPQFSEEQREAFAQNPGETILPDGFARDVRDEIGRALTSRIDSDVNRFYVIRSDLAAVLGLQTIAKFVEKRRLKQEEHRAPTDPVSEAPSPSHIEF